MAHLFDEGQIPPGILNLGQLDQMRLTHGGELYKKRPLMAIQILADRGIGGTS